MKKGILTLALFLCCLPAQAFAGSGVHSGTNGFEWIDAGVFDIGFDNLLLIDYDEGEISPDSDDTSSVFEAGWIGGIKPRYFVARNFSIGLDINIELASKTQTTTIGGTETSTESSDFTLIPFLTANYYLRLGNSLFFKPGIGVGGFWGTREQPGETSGTKAESTILGGAGLLDLGFVYYASPHFNLRAGLNLIGRFGSVTPNSDEGDEESLGFTAMDAGVSAGLGYSF